MFDDWRIDSFAKLYSWGHDDVHGHHARDDGHDDCDGHEHGEHDAV